MTAEPIYLDHQATTPVDPRVVEAMSRYWNDGIREPPLLETCLRVASGGGGGTGRDEPSPTLISADADEIVFTSGATEANNLAILGLLGHGGCRQGPA